ncbi:hypothetical protein Desaci_1451 [Desulfosporosinus acidiphilus SJ4]|uniref:Uncharacterized protein n=1 Tax=Desulfosporosinus acidiphilus (strain DSM 22704 / JCM 16185 / SJ4) TaxID=646529 RepID=I4D3U4_DESAJ|nr:hypothetical protein [Desulfosporosinus acidiphilus]AFM40468.1 hypothetical protein Desaci_1451 [Desulfosporosinus acidiphilus SJ4]
MDKWFETFFEEKDMPFKTFEIEHHGTIHLIDSDFVIKLIKTCSEEEKKAIQEMLIRIDFRNGDVNDYLHHLAVGYVKTHF